MGAPRDRFFVLDASGEPQPCSVDTWAAMSEDFAKRCLGEAKIADVRVVTVFHGFDPYRFSDEEPPHLFGTLVERPGLSFERIYRTRSEALAGHARALAIVTSSTPEAPWYTDRWIRGDET